MSFRSFRKLRNVYAISITVNNQLFYDLYICFVFSHKHLMNPLTPNLTERNGCRTFALNFFYMITMFLISTHFQMAVIGWRHWTRYNRLWMNGSRPRQIICTLSQYLVPEISWHKCHRRAISSCRWPLWMHLVNRKCEGFVWPCFTGGQNVQKYHENCHTEPKSSCIDSDWKGCRNLQTMQQTSGHGPIGKS